MKKTNALTLVAKSQDELVVKRRGAGIKTIAKILELIKKTGFHEVEIKLSTDFLIRVKTRMEVEFPAQAKPTLDASLSNIQNVQQDKNLHIVKSPLVGTFYRAQSSTTSPFVKVGDVVKKGQILCLVGAMKLMNSVEAEKDGKISAILVEDKQPIEYGEPLFEIEL